MSENEKNQDRLEAAFEQVVNRLHIDVRPRSEHQKKLQQQVLKEFDKASLNHQTDHPDTGDLIPQVKMNLTQRIIAMKNVNKVAAAIIIVVAITVIYLSTGSIFADKVSWADVLEQINTVKTMSYVAFVDGTNYQVYVKDPGKSRMEILGPDQQAWNVMIFYNQKDQRVHIQYSMGDPDIYERTIWPASDINQEMENQALRMWDIFKKVTSDQARKIGEKIINGKAAVGFRADLQDKTFWIPFKGTVEVWVDRHSAIPIRARSDFVAESDRPQRYIWRDIKWNIPLAEELFQAPSGRKVIDYEHKPVHFTRTLLKDNVTVWVGPRGGEPILTEKNITQIPRGEILLTRSNGAEKRRITIYVHLDDFGREILGTYTTEHIQEKLLIDFNGEFISEPIIALPIWGGIMVINLSESEISLEDFEKKYLRDKYN